MSDTVKSINSIYNVSNYLEDGPLARRMMNGLLNFNVKDLRELQYIPTRTLLRIPMVGRKSFYVYLCPLCKSLNIKPSLDYVSNKGLKRLAYIKLKCTIQEFTDIDLKEIDSTLKTLFKHMEIIDYNYSLSYRSILND